ncbi:class I SAM-dependent methyltransferase [Geodermatophilus poikilotrophus]|uniref:Methyltransferase domain-containing protein n=1 Tax=Geodermatophilus poikilotrophus TaxID=1333667 RepID=A0A1I0BJI1_9ACTN|nr:class I SAM-dependent methyltransferase [Geodermatophilus poikilotrophus]SET07155.1 Methyltransferase domain-containing protein [Geodermatophilus poikilotrophus]
MSRLVAVAKLLRGGGLPWLRASRDGLAAVRVAVGAAGLSTGVLECLQDGPADTASVRARLGLDDGDLLEPWLRVLQGHGLVRASAGRWSLSRRGRRLLDDEVVRAAYEGFAGYHTGLYRELPAQLHGGPARRDIAEQGETIAQLTRAMEPVLHAALVAAARTVRPTRILDVGCGAGQNLAALLAAAPAAEGTGIEVDEAVADIAERLLAQRGLAGRARVLRGDVLALAAGGGAGGPYDLALLANVVYYLPLAERVPLFRALAGLLSEGGALLVTTTAATPDPFSRHFDLLLRAQGEGMELPEVEPLRRQLADAGLQPEPARQLVPGQPLVAVLARR